MIFIVRKIFLEIGHILIDLILNYMFPMKPSEFRISISIESYDEKTAENCRNCYVFEKRIVCKLPKISATNFNSTNWRIEWRLCEYFTSLSLILSKKWASKNIMVNGYKTLFHFFFSIFLKALEPFECQRSDPYTAVYRNFTRFAHS